jgi:hypothetical protein
MIIVLLRPVSLLKWSVYAIGIWHLFFSKLFSESNDSRMVSMLINETD